jgi:serine protease Do
MKYFFPIILLTICSCSQPSENKNSSYEDSLKIKETELLKREISIKDKEIAESKKELEEANKKEIPISELYKQVKTGVFIIYTKGEDNISQGTGFFLKSTGIAISNYHVFENADRAIVILDNGEKCLISKIITANKDLDYIIFQVDNPLNACYPLQISNDIAEIGSTCFAIGNPKGLFQTLSIGNISGYREENKLIQTTTEITHGSSGGPLFNRNGKVIGITSSGYGEANLNFALNISKVSFQEYLSSNESTTFKNEIVPTEKIKSTINTYYSTIYNNDYTTLKDLYTPTLDRFFSAFNISQSEAVEKAKSYWTQFKIISASNKINWETLKITPSTDETFYVEFNMDYNIERIEKKKNKSFNLNIIMTITKDMKIKSIYENIIRSK